MVNQFSAATGTMDYGSQLDLLNKAIDLIWLRRDNYNGELEQFFEKTNAPSLTYKMSSVGSSLPDVPVSADNDNLHDVQPAPGWDGSVTIYVYRMGISVTDTLLKADRFGKVRSMMTGLTKAAMRTLETMRAAIFNNAFATTALDDGQYLCGNSHPQLNPEAGTWDNLGTTGTLSYTTLQELRLLGMNMDNEVGKPDPVIGKVLLCKPDQEQAAREIINSKYIANSSVNTETQLVNNLPVVVSPYLTISTGAYFLIGDKEGEDRGLFECQFIPPNLADVGDEVVDRPIHKRVKFAVAMKAMPTQNIIGNIGT